MFWNFKEKKLDIKEVSCLGNMTRKNKPRPIRIFVTYKPDLNYKERILQKELSLELKKKTID